MGRKHTDTHTDNIEFCTYVLNTVHHGFLLRSELLCTWYYSTYWNTAVCVCVCVFFPFILDFNGRTSRGHFFCPADHVPDWQPRILLGMVEARSVNVKKTTTTTQGEGNTGFSIHLLSAVLALIFLARRIQPFLSLVDRVVEFCVLTI